MLVDMPPSHSESAVGLPEPGQLPTLEQEIANKSSTVRCAFDAIGRPHRFALGQKLVNAEVGLSFSGFNSFNTFNRLNLWIYLDWALGGSFSWLQWDQSWSPNTAGNVPGLLFHPSSSPPWPTSSLPSARFSAWNKHTLLWYLVDEECRTWGRLFPKWPSIRFRFRVKDVQGMCKDVQGTHFHTKCFCCIFRLCTYNHTCHAEYGVRFDWRKDEQVLLSWMEDPDRRSTTAARVEPEWIGP